jgi:hypothetical protein
MLLEFRVPLAVAKAIGAERMDFAAQLSADDPYYEPRIDGDAVAVRCSRDVAQALRSKLAASGRLPTAAHEGGVYAAIEAIDAALEGHRREDVLDAMNRHELPTNE